MTLRRFHRLLLVLSTLLLATVPSHASVVLGTGTAALLGGDLTDPENDGVEDAMTNLGANFDAVFSTNDEVGFEGGEFAFNVFDNKAEAGNDKWCCNAPSPGSPLWVQAELPAPQVLRAFTIATGNDVQPGRDPDVWRLQGSNDGTNFTDIYVYDHPGVSPFSAPKQVVAFYAGSDFAEPPAYKFFRYQVESVVDDADNTHHLNELELYSTVPAGATMLADGATCTLHDAILAANLGTTVGGCTGSALPDVIVLGANVTLTTADTGIITSVDHTGHASDTLGGYAGLPDVTSSLTIQAGAGSVIARDAALDCDSGEPSAFRLLTVRDAGILRLEGVTLRNGCIAPPNGTAYGGALLAESSSLVLEGATLEGNTARGTDLAGGAGDAYGGGVFFDQQSAIEIDGATLRDNRARAGDTTSGAGGLASGGAAATESPGILIKIANSLFDGNLAVGGASSDGGAEGGSAQGGALQSSGRLGLIEQSVFTDNEAQGGDGVLAGGNGRGGALEHEDQVFAGTVGSAFRRNAARGGDASGGPGGAAVGGAFHLNNGGSLLSGCAFVDNLAQSGTGVGAGSVYGGAVSAFDALERVENTTFSGNVAQNSGAGEARGGALFADGATFYLTTIVGNAAIAASGGTAGDGAIAHDGDSPALAATLLADNTTTLGATTAASNCPTGLTSLGYNLAEGACAGLSATGDQTVVDAEVGAASGNGCTEQLPDGSCVDTVTLPSTSPAVDAGSCTAAGLDEDARGVARPVDLAPANADDGCDVGALERRPNEDVGPLFSDGFESGSTGQWSSSTG